MAHDHDHQGSEYYIEQLFTILVCGALGVVAIRMYQTDKLSLVLAPPFHVPVLIGGIAILALVALRAIALWRESGREMAHHHDHAHDHSHDHAHDHDHDHGHEDHSHDHSHDHAHSHGHKDHSHEDHGHSHDLSWTFVRLLILIFPVALYMLGVPNAGYSSDHLKKLLANEVTIGKVDFSNVKTSGAATEVRFNDLNDAAYDPAKRESFQGTFVELTGRMHKVGDKEFTLFKLKMTCCAADTVPLKVRIVTQQSLNSFKDSEWVHVKGQLEFLEVPGTSRYIPVIKATQVEGITAPPGGDYE